MPRAKHEPPAEVEPEIRSYGVVAEYGYHHPDGFVPLGGTIDLLPEQAERGLAAGLLQLTPTKET